jgi:hypothetical protein
MELINIITITIIIMIIIIDSVQITLIMVIEKGFITIKSRFLMVIMPINHQIMESLTIMFNLKNQKVNSMLEFYFI